MRYRLSFVLFLLFVASLALPIPLLASPQPTPVCGFCGDQFASTAETNITVDDSTAVVQVHENGSVTWTVRNRLSTGSEAFREHPDLLDATASRLAETHHGPPGEVQFVSARLDGETAVLVYHDPDAARRHAGLLVVDYLHDRGYEPLYYVNADRFTIRGPDGTVVTNAPEGGSVEGRNATWRGSPGRAYGSGADLGGSPYVVFGPDDSTGTTLRTTVALGLATLPIVVRGLWSFVVFQTLAFAVVLGVVSLGLRRWSPEPTPERMGALLAGLGLLGVVGPIVGQRLTLDLVTGPPVFALGLGLAVQGDRLCEELRSDRSQVLLAAVLLVATFAVLVPIYAVGTRFDRPILVAAKATAFAVPLAAMLPLGAVLDERRRAVRWWLLAVVGFVLLAISTVNPADPPTGLGGGLTTVFLFVLAFVVPLVGAPVVVLGRRLAGESAETLGDERNTTAPAD